MALIGILNVNKPAGLTSRNVVDRVERLTRPAKAGHAGTLDPLATGVLVVCVGQATRVIRFVQQMRKSYLATFLLGFRSDTDDTEGQIVAIPNAIQPARAGIDRVLSRFIGDVQQRPPIHSAIKLAGRRAYQLARRGATFELPARTVTIFRIRVARYEYPKLELEIECGSGTYVRALGRDIAAALGSAAVMSALKRTAVGTFIVEDAVALDELTAETLPDYLQPPLAAGAYLPRIELADEQLTEIRHGRPILKPTECEGMAQASETSEWMAVNRAGKLVAILKEKHTGQLWPSTNFG